MAEVTEVTEPTQVLRWDMRVRGVPRWRRGRHEHGVFRQTVQRSPARRAQVADVGAGPAQLGLGRAVPPATATATDLQVQTRALLGEMGRDAAGRAAGGRSA